MEIWTVSIDLHSVSAILQVISLKLVVRSQRNFIVLMFDTDHLSQGLYLSKFPFADTNHYKTFQSYCFLNYFH